MGLRVGGALSVVRCPAVFQGFCGPGFVINRPSEI